MFVNFIDDLKEIRESIYSNITSELVDGKDYLQVKKTW